MEVDITEIQKQVADAAVNAVCGSASITSESRRDAIALLFAYVLKTKKNAINIQEMDRLLSNAYNYFEYGNTLCPELEQLLS